MRSFSQAHFNLPQVLQMTEMMKTEALTLNECKHNVAKKVSVEPEFKQGIIQCWLKNAVSFFFEQENCHQ